MGRRMRSRVEREVVVRPSARAPCVIKPARDSREDQATAVRLPPQSIEASSAFLHRRRVEVSTRPRFQPRNHTHHNNTVPLRHAGGATSARYSPEKGITGRFGEYANGPVPPRNESRGSATKSQQWLENQQADCEERYMLTAGPEGTATTIRRTQRWQKTSERDRLYDGPRAHRPVRYVAHGSRIVLGLGHRNGGAHRSKLYTLD